MNNITIPWIYSAGLSFAEYFGTVVEREMPGTKILNLAGTESFDDILTIQRTLIIVHDQWSFCNEVNPQGTKEITKTLTEIRNKYEQNRHTPIILTHLGIGNPKLIAEYAQAGTTKFVDIYNSQNNLDTFIDAVWSTLIENQRKKQIT
jgi:hypothetical protein